jgi:hypothetical protein
VIGCVTLLTRRYLTFHTSHLERYEVVGCADISNMDEVVGCADISNMDEVVGCSDFSNMDEVVGCSDISDICSQKCTIHGKEASNALSRTRDRTD